MDCRKYGYAGSSRGTTLFEAMIEPRLDNRPCGGKYGDIVQAIGHTPLVELKRFSPKPGVRIYAKLESYNPTGSVKDRVARSMIEDAEAQGAIALGQTILEPTSGNTGISLAMICSRKGYPLKVVMPDNVTAERTQLLRMHGSEIVYSPGEHGSNGAVAMALEMAQADPSYYMPYQYGNEANPRAHYEGTAVEILDELETVDVFVAGLGTGGTLMATAAASRKRTRTRRSSRPSRFRGSSRKPSSAPRSGSGGRALGLRLGLVRRRHRRGGRCCRKRARRLLELLDVVVVVAADRVQRVLELANALAQRTADFGQALGTED